MLDWINSQEKRPEPHQHILVTIKENGKPTVVACSMVDKDRIQIGEGPTLRTYSFSIVKAWLPFPKPYEEKALVSMD
jgi:hypothetical protein